MITPATLSFTIAPVLKSSMMIVPRADFNSLRFISPGEVWGLTKPAPMQYNGPSHAVQRVAQAVSSTGSTLSIKPPAFNATWNLSFPGPYLSCSNLNDTFKAEVLENIMLEYRNGSFCQTYHNYLAWTASPGNSGELQLLQRTGGVLKDSAMPFAKQKPYPMNTGTLGPIDYAQLNEGPKVFDAMDATEVATIYIATMPAFHNLDLGSCPLGNYTSNIQNLYAMFDNSTFLQCELWNTTYQASFSYVNGTQSIDLEFPFLDEAEPVNTLAGFFLDDEGCGQIDNSNSSCSIDTKTLQRLSYQAIMDALGQVLVGAVHLGDFYEKSTSTSYTSILSTALLDTPELAFLQAESSFPQADYGRFRQNASSSIKSLYDWNTQNSQESLETSLERLFQNITISMMGFDDFQ